MDTALDTYLDKLWHTLFSKGVPGLVSPDEIRRRGQPHRQVRAAELREVARVQRELTALVEGRLELTAAGRLSEAVDDTALNAVRLNPVIEQSGAGWSVTPLDAASLLSQAGLAESVREVRRALTLRHIAVLAEEEGRRLPRERLQQTGVDPDWLVRWQDAAAGCVSIELKRLWARLLAGEVVRPGTYSVRTLEFLRLVSRRDLEMVSLCARFAFDGFIYRQPGRYFSATLHLPLFETLEELGLLRGVYGRPETWLLTSATGDRFRAILPCQHRAIFIERGAGQDDLRFPVYRLTRFGREVLSLFPVEADTAYLLAVAGEFKKQGCEVQLGDWMHEGGQGLFAERLSL